MNYRCLLCGMRNIKDASFLRHLVDKHKLKNPNSVTWTGWGIPE